MSKGFIKRSLSADGCFHVFDNERVSGEGMKSNKKIECMKDADVCRTCTKEKCSGTQKCVEKRKKELAALAQAEKQEGELI